MTTKNFVVKNGLTTGNIILDASSSNITANVVVANLSVPATANLGAVGNITITGGSSGQVLQTNGSGSLSWVDQSGGGGTASYATITIDNFTGDGTETEFTLSVSPSDEKNITVNYNGALQLHSAYTLSGSTLTMSEAPSDGSTLEVTSITGLVAANNASFTTRTYTGDGSETDYTVNSGTTVSSVLVTENGVLQVPTTDYTISGTTLTFTTAPANGVHIQIRELSVVTATSTYGNSDVASYLLTNTANISAGYFIGNGSQLTGLPASYGNSNVAAYLPTYTGNVGGNFFVGNGASLGSIANLHVTGGTSGQAIVTDGAGNLSFGTAGVPLGKTVALNMFLGF